MSILKHSLLLLALLALVGCSTAASATPTPSTVPPTPEPTATLEPMAALVNGEGIPVAFFEQEVQRYLAAQAALGETISIDQAAPLVLNDLIDQLLLAQGAHAVGYRLDDAGLQARIDALSTDLGGIEALNAWLSTHGYSDASFRYALRLAAEAAWMRDNLAGGVPATAEQVHVRQILLYNEAAASSLLEQLDAGADFDTLAWRYDPFTGGELGWVPRGYLLSEQIEAAVFSLQAGDFSPVVASDVGYHILLVTERDPQRPLSPDALLTLQEQAVRDWLIRQRAEADIMLAP